MYKSRQQLIYFGASINFLNDEAIKDEHINWKKKKLGGWHN
jgi:hypothetical protein